MQNRNSHLRPDCGRESPTMGRRGPAATWGRIGPNKEEQLSQATKLSHHAAHVPLFGTPTPLTQPPCARVLFFLSFFLSFLLNFLYSFSFGSFLFLFSFVSFFVSFGQSIGRFCRFDVTDFVKSGQLNYLVFNTLKITDVTKMSNRKYKIVKSNVQILSNRYFPKESGSPKASSTFVSFSLNF